MLDLARPYVGTGLRPWQSAAALATVAALWAVLRERGRTLREALPWLALAAFLIPTYVDHSRNMESDGIHYYSYLRSVLFDRDLDLRNDYQLLGWANPNQRNVLPIGAIRPLRLEGRIARPRGIDRCVDRVVRFE